jgi:hypothetical protein
MKARIGFDGHDCAIVWATAVPSVMITTMATVTKCRRNPMP